MVKGGRQVQCKLTKTRFGKSMSIQLIKSGKEQKWVVEFTVSWVCGGQPVTFGDSENEGK